MSETSEISTLTQCLGRQGPVCVAFSSRPHNLTSYILDNIEFSMFCINKVLVSKQAKHCKVSPLEGSQISIKITIKY